MAPTLGSVCYGQGTRSVKKVTETTALVENIPNPPYVLRVNGL